MVPIKIITYISIFLSIVACKNQKNKEIYYENEYLVRQSFYPSGKIRTKQYFINDTIKEGYYYQYFKDGKLDIEIPFRNDKRHGVLNSYFEDGSLHGTYKYTDGAIEGPAVWFYRNQDTFIKANYVNGKRVGIEQEFYLDRKLKNWNWRNSNGLIVFQITFDTLGNLTKTKGIPFIDSRGLIGNDSMVVELVPVQVLKVRERFHYVIEKDSIQIKDVPVDIYTNDTINWVLFKHQEQKGYKYYGKVILYDTLDNKIGEFTSEIVH